VTRRFLDGSNWPAFSPRIFALLVVAMLATQILVLVLMGQPLSCECGHIDVWHGSASGPETSQHFADWYSLTHVAHGFVFYFLIWLVLRNASLSIVFVLALALGVEVSWEIVENTPVVIERYRQTALAAGYFGDSVVNSIGDTLAMILGFVVARKVPVWFSIVVLIGLELFLAFAIHDNLTLNIIQLVYPLDAISQWQANG
jgi:hypothetical protein